MNLFECFGPWQGEESFGIISVGGLVSDIELIWIRWFHNQIENDGVLDLILFCDHLAVEHNYNAHRVDLVRLTA